MALDSPHSLLRKPSLFRRFSRREKKPLGTITCKSTSDLHLRPQTAHRRDSSMQARTPSPTRREQPQFGNPITTTITNTTTSSSRSSSSSSSKSLKPEIITHIRRIDQPSPPSTPNPAPARHPTKVSPTALPTLPFPASKSIKTTPWTLFLPPAQVSALYHGFLPTLPSDEWYIYSEGPDLAGKLKVHFHQRWTGIKVAELFVILDLRGEGAGKTLGIKWNGSSQMNRMGEEEARFLVRDGCRGALGIGLEGEVRRR